MTEGERKDSILMLLVHFQGLTPRRPTSAEIVRALIRFSNQNGLINEPVYSQPCSQPDEILRSLQIDLGQLEQQGLVQRIQGVTSWQVTPAGYEYAPARRLEGLEEIAKVLHDVLIFDLPVAIAS